MVVIMMLKGVVITIIYNCLNVQVGFNIHKMQMTINKLHKNRNEFKIFFNTTENIRNRYY